MAGLLMVASTAGQAQVIYKTGFEANESPPYQIGDLSGQNGWMVVPGTASGTIQSDVVYSGLQAVSLIDGASFGRAQVNIATSEIFPTLRSRYSLMASSEWGTIPPEVLDRFEGQRRLEFTDAQGSPVGVEFGLLCTNIEYNGLPAGSRAWYIEVTSGEVLIDSSYHIIPGSDPFGRWYSFDLLMDMEAGLASLRVDHALRAEAEIPTSLTALSVLQLQNERWGTNPNNSEPLYFDGLFVAIPTPGTGLLMLGGAILLGGRPRRNP